MCSGFSYMIKTVATLYGFVSFIVPIVYLIVGNHNPETWIDIYDSMMFVKSVF